MNIDNFNDRCRYVLLSHIEGKRTKRQTKELNRLAKLYASSSAEHLIRQYLFGEGYIKSKCNNPMKDENEEDIYTTENGIDALSNGRFPSEWMREQGKNQDKWIDRSLFILSAFGITGFITFFSKLKDILFEWFRKIP